MLANLSTKLIHTLNIVGLIAVLVVNFLANYLPIGGFQTGELSAMHPSLFTPAGFTFSIWGIIYLMLIVWTVYVAWGLSKGDPIADRIVQTIGPWFIINCIANIAWIFVWHHQQILLALILMFIILISLIQIYRAIDQEWLENNTTTTFTVCLPFSIYFGWISVATIANTSVYLISIDWNGWGIPAATWTVIMLGIVGLLGLFVLWKERDTSFALIFVWALWGISRARIDGEFPNIASTAMTILSVLLIGIFVAMYAKWKYGRA